MNEGLVLVAWKGVCFRVEMFFVCVESGRPSVAIGSAFQPSRFDLCGWFVSFIFFSHFN